MCNNIDVGWPQILRLEWNAKVPELVWIDAKVKTNAGIIELHV
jgi:hypothetical protein